MSVQLAERSRVKRPGRPERRCARGGGARAGAVAFARAAPVYWGSVYPQVRREVALQRERAAAIPDPRLREIALEVVRAKRANVDGSAAFAAFVPAGRRRAVIGAQVAFQSLYDHLDTLAEMPHPEPVANSRALHAALSAALDADGGEAFTPPADLRDGGFLQATVARCQQALATLPSYPAVQTAACRLADHIVAFQSFNVAGGAGEAELEAWARKHTPPSSDLRWWETAASAGSSLGLFALFAVAAEDHAEASHAPAIEQAYFPWVGALHSLLDGLVDRSEDQASGQPNPIENYESPEEAAARLAMLARASRRQAESLPHPGWHLAILAAMASTYLAEPQSREPHAIAARNQVLAELRPLGAPAMAVMRLRRLLVG